MKNIADILGSHQKQFDETTKQLQAIKQVIKTQTTIEPASIKLKQGQLTIYVNTSIEAGELRLHQSKLLAALSRFEVSAIKLSIKH